MPSAAPRARKVLWRWKNRPVYEAIGLSGRALSQAEPGAAAPKRGICQGKPDEDANKASVQIALS